MVKSVAEELAKGHKEISVSEFFEKNKHILGFGSPSRAILTSVKEAVDNSLDACEEVGQLPQIKVTIIETEPGEYRLTIEDNGPGIVKKSIPNVFGKLLYGSRFHSIRQSRGQQGIGISAVVMYSQLTTGRPTRVLSKTAGADVASLVIMQIHTKKNAPDVIVSDFEPWEKEQGTLVEFHLRGKYKKGKQSVSEYLRGTAIVNPHAEIYFEGPDGEKTHFERVAMLPPPKTKEIKPHPKGLELGQLMTMAKHTQAKKIKGFLHTEFSRISYRVADEMLEKAGIPETRSPKRINLDEFKSLLNAIETTKIMAPQTDCLSPIGEVLIKKGLKNVIGENKPDYYVPPVSRSPQVYQGNPFQVEVGMVYGGELSKDGQVEILRFANRVPLLFQQGACVTTKAIQAIDWRRYGLEQRGGKGIPFGPAIILVHVASTKIPFTSEAKEAIADIDLIHDEMVKALRDTGRKTKSHLNKKLKKKKAQAKFDLIAKVIPEIAKKSANVLGRPIPDLSRTITQIMGVVWIDDEITYGKKFTDITINLHNYTDKAQSFDLYTLLPIEKMDMERTQPPPDSTERGNRVLWEISKLKSTESMIIKIRLNTSDKDEFDENEFFVSKINPSIVLGADPLPGDWNLDIPSGNGDTEDVVVEEEEESVEEEIDDLDDDVLEDDGSSSDDEDETEEEDQVSDDDDLPQDEDVPDDDTEDPVEKETPVKVSEPPKRSPPSKVVSTEQEEVKIITRKVKGSITKKDPKKQRTLGEY